MTPTYLVVGDQLQEQPRMKEPAFDYSFPPDGPSDSMLQSALLDYDGSLNSYEAHLLSLRCYTIRPSDWEGITEVNEGEFRLKMEVLDEHDGYADARLLAVPLRPAKGQSFSVTREQLEDLWDAAIKWDYEFQGKEVDDSDYVNADKETYINQLLAVPLRPAGKGTEERLFTLEEMKECYEWAWVTSGNNFHPQHIEMSNYFKTKFGITLNKQ